MRSFRNQNKQQVRTLIVRIIALFIALLMVLGVIITAVVSVAALGEDPSAVQMNDEKIKVFDDNDFLFRIGILYSDDVLDSHRLRTHDKKNDVEGDLGYHLFATKGTELTYIWTVSQSMISICADGNLKSSESKGIISYKRSSSGTIGGYHLLIDGTYDTPEAVMVEIASLNEKNTGINIFAWYENGKYMIKCGSYTTLDAAKAESEKYSALLEKTCTAVGYTDTSIKVLNNSDGKILFGFDCKNEYGLGTYPEKKDGDERYLKLDPYDYYRAGVFEFKRSYYDGCDGLSLIMITELEEYIEGVVPWEISASYPIETIKAFAITVRSYTYQSLAKHSNYEFDICSTSHCQVHKGHSRVNQRVKDAVKVTKDQVLVCGNELVRAYYHALSGGSIAAGHQVWNQAELPYLQGMFTPWEKLDRDKGSWSYSATPKELCDSLRAEGYTVLKDEIKDVKITLCDNSSYVYQVIITDIHGNTQTITRNRNVKNAFGDYLLSGNFVISHNGVIEDGKDDTKISGIYVMTAEGLKVIRDEEKLNVQTALGVQTTTMPETLKVKTSTSMVTCDVLAETKAFVNGAGTVSEENGDFTFIGSGYGHGVGLSQLGSKDMADLGKTFDQILYTYFPNTKIMYYEEFKK